MSAGAGAAVAGRSEGARCSGDALYLALMVVLGALLRLDFMRATGGVIDADEAIVGLMGKHILEGRGVPVFYYGQHYMGSLEALMASALFRLFGLSTYALQAVPLVWSLLLIVVIYALGCECGGRVVGRIAALLTAVPPVTLVVWSAKARGGFIELVVLGAVSLVATVRWGRADPCALRFPAVIGVVLGIGWWVNNQILYFLLPIAVFGAVHLGAALARRGASRGAGVSLWSVLAVVLVGVGCFLLGGAPYWWYNVMHGFPSLGMFGRAPLAEIVQHLRGVVSTALPILLGARHFWESEQETFRGAAWVYYAVYGGIFGAVAVARWQARALLWWGAARGEWCVRRGLLGWVSAWGARLVPSGMGACGVELLLLFALVTVAIFAVSTFGWLVQAPRYLLPLYVAVVVVCAYFCAGVMRVSRGLGVLAVGVLVTLNVTSSYAGGRAIPGEPVVFQGARVARDHGELVATLERLGISRVRTNYWIGYRLAFETAERVTFVMAGEPHQVRIPWYEEGLSATEREVAPIVAVPSEVTLLRDGLRRLGYQFREELASGYTVFYDLRADLRELRRLEQGDFAEVRAVGPQSVEGALDGSVTTRWGSGEPQRPGQSFEITLAAPTVLQAVRYELGAWEHDYPRGLELDLQRLDGSWERVLTPQEYEGIRYLINEHTSFLLRFEPREVRAVRLLQTGRDGRMDWSIAELELFAHAYE